MRIGFDVSQTADSMAGCGVFAAELFKALITEGLDDTFIPYPVFSGYRSAAYRQALRPEVPNVDARLHDLDWAAVNAGWDQTDRRHQFLGEPDIVHSNSFGCPSDLGVPLVYTVYDLSPVEHPEFHTEANRLACFNGLFEASVQADHFLAISKFSRDRFLHWFPHVAASDVTIVYPAARFTAVGDDGDAREVLDRLGLVSGSFWLAVGTVEPRKNYGTLIDAYARLVAERPDSLPLCIVGQAGWKETPVGQRALELGLADRVTVTGFLPDEDLAVLYRHTFGLVFPSHYEGFGLPVIEALASGAPVIASRTSSLPEVVGDAGLLVAPDDPEALTAAMRRLSDDGSLRARLKDASLTQAAEFSWQGAARRTLDVYHHVQKRP